MQCELKQHRSLTERQRCCYLSPNCN